MGTKTFVGIAACCAFFVSSAIAQESTLPASSHSPLNETLYQSVCGRVQAPMVFSTRDTVFALSLPTDEPAEVYVKLTVGKNGKVKEKETRVHANHIAGYVAPAFMAATKELKIDKSLLAGMQGKDTSLLLTFPLEYCHVLDTTVMASRADAHPYQSELFYKNMIKPWSKSNKNSREYSPGKYFGTGFELENPYIDSPRFPQPDSYSGPLSFYIVFIKGQQE